MLTPAEIYNSLNMSENTCMHDIVLNTYKRTANPYVKPTGFTSFCFCIIIMLLLILREQPGRIQEIIESVGKSLLSEYIYIPCTKDDMRVYAITAFLFAVAAFLINSSHETYAVIDVNYT